MDCRIFTRMEERDPAITNGPITADERTYALDLLHTTRDALRQAVAGLSDAQQQYKPTPDRWSIAENVEHIVLVERGIFRTVQKAMDLPADGARRSTIKVSDVYVIKAVRSRGRGVATVAPAPFVPTGRFGDLAGALTAFEQQRADVVAYVQTAPDDLRLHYFEHFVLGTLDAYQALLLLASHGERHRKQIEEVKSSENFPA